MSTAPAVEGLGYAINDADNHFNEPPDCFEQYIDPGQRHLAIRSVRDASGATVQLFAGKPSKFHAKQVTYSDEELANMLGDTSELKRDAKVDEGDGEALPTIPGMLLNRLNPLKGLSEEERKAFIAEFRHKSEAFGNRDLRLALMDEQGIDKAVMFPVAAHNIEYEFVDDIEAMYANTRAFNRWMHEDPGFSAENRMFLPAYIPLADPELAAKELEQVLADGARVIMTKAGHAHGGADNPWGGRSVADPVYDRVWSMANEAKVRYTVHLGGTDYQKYGADWSYDPATTFGDFDAFQWMWYWGDRPGMELSSALVLHNFFGRFPDIKVLLAEMGTVWVPYTLRKMDHAYLMGRKARYHETGHLDARPSEIFKENIYVMPFPEENVQRIAAEVGTDCLVFGSDFPHGEGLARPAEYADAQLGAFDATDVRKIMRDNMEEFLAPAVG